MPRTQADSARRPTYIIVPYNAKLADISETDTNKHTVNVATALGESRKVVSLILVAIRIAGTGNFFSYPNEGAQPLWIGNGQAYANTVIIADGTQRLQYSQTVANDDFDVYCFGYVVSV